MGWITAAYANVGVGYDPAEIPPILSFPLLTKDLSSRPLDKLYLTDFKLSHSPNSYPDDRSVLSDLTHLSMSNKTLVSQVQKEPPVIPKPPVHTDFVDESSPNPRSLQAKHGLNVINKHYEKETSYKQRKSEYTSNDEGNDSTYPDIEEFTRQMDNFAAQGPKYTTPYTNSRSKGVVPRVILRDSTAAPSMSWLTSTSVANIRRGVQGYGTPVQPSLLYSNIHTNPSQSASRPFDTRVTSEGNETLTTTRLRTPYSTSRL